MNDVIRVSDETKRLMRWATWASVSVASLLILAKLLAWFITDAVSVLATLLDSCLDVFASLLNMLAVRHALMPPDEEHRFGHGKAEALSGLAQSMFITGSALFLILESLRRLWHPQAIQQVDIGIMVMILSIVLTIALLTFQRYVIKQTNSTAIRADALHYQSDLYANAAVILALVLAAWGWIGFDALFGLAIACFILYGAWGIIHQAWDELMDRELPDEDREKIEGLALLHPKAESVHDLRTRKAGLRYYIQLHLVLDANMALRDAHRVADEVEAQIQQAYPSADILIHQDPSGLIEPLPEHARTKQS
ncbi:MAG: cation diffusion facilitator family transporter [Mariprofundaceae bacterium]|nr:cation diffusion facilitator family transporter [Mariprofundaceae bacterium]